MYALAYTCVEGVYTLVMFVCACAAALPLFSAREQLPTGSWRCCDWSKCVRCSCTDPCVTATPVQWPCVDWVISHVNCVQITPERWGRGRWGCGDRLSEQAIVCFWHIYGWHTKYYSSWHSLPVTRSLLAVKTHTHAQERSHMLWLNNSWYVEKRWNSWGQREMLPSS